MEIKYPLPLQILMDHLKNLPGVGRRTAERMALTMYGWNDPRLTDLAETLRTLHERVGLCRECGNLADSGPDGSFLCPICASPARDRTTLCVVEEASQIRVIESAGVFRGIYHVLGGRIAPLSGKTPESLTIPALKQRLASGGIRELILALSPDVEGQATAIYLSRLFQDSGLRITRPAQGLPAGADMLYADPATMAAALSGRTRITNGDEE